MGLARFCMECAVCKLEFSSVFYEVFEPHGSNQEMEESIIHHLASPPFFGECIGIGLKVSFFNLCPHRCYTTRLENSKFETSLCVSVTISASRGDGV